MPYTLTLLGTDTQFSPNRLEGAYDKAETLSYVSTLVSNNQPQDRTFPTDEIVKYRTSKIAVVDGPTTLGTEVGDRIARGVEAILEAISRGETDISIIAHSRGAVEAILVAHELERIQSLVEKGNFNRYQLTNSECRYTNRAMNRDANHTKAFDSLNLKKLLIILVESKYQCLILIQYLAVTTWASLTLHHSHGEILVFTQYQKLLRNMNSILMKMRERVALNR